MKHWVLVFLLAGHVLATDDGSLGHGVMTRLQGLASSGREDDLRAVSDFYKRINGAQTPIDHPTSLVRLREIGILNPDNTVKTDVRESILLWRKKNTVHDEL
jgi:hypothetical protein